MRNEFIETSNYSCGVRELDAALENLRKVMNGQRVNCLPSDVDKVIINDKKIIVNLTDGRKGIASLSGEDEMDAYTGFTIAYYKAKNAKSFELKQILDGCVKSAKKKGYEQAILRNY